MRELLRLIILLAALAALLVFSPAWGRGDCESPAQPRNNHAPAGDFGALEAWLDPYLTAKMRALHVPGAAAVIVKDGRILLSKGYGFASLRDRRPVEAERTLFRVASVSKLFTATAVMQLAEQGKLDLHTDVNRYLRRFQIEDPFGRPVTLGHLLTHTAGFDERFTGMAARTPAEALPLGEYLARRMPPRVLPPGELISYSNHGLALAGYVVEEVSGIPFARYAEDNILRPLGMRHSSFELRADLARALAVGYEFKGGRYLPVPLDSLDQLGPAGGLNATATDVARFMLAQLQLGHYESSRILKESSAREMQRQQFTHHPRLPGFGFGFYEHYENGLRGLAHGGSHRGFASLLFLLPEKNTGLFLAWNRQEPRLGLELVTSFLDRYFPAPSAPGKLQPAPGFAPPAARFAGSYRPTRYSRRTFEKIVMLLESFQLAAQKDGSLRLRYFGRRGEATRWVQVDRLLFERDDGNVFLAFREDRAGRITHLFLQAFGMPVALERLAWYEVPQFQLGLVIFMFFFFLSASVGWPTARIVYWGHRREVPPPGWARSARLLAGAASGLNVLFFVSVELAFRDVAGLRLEYGMPPWLAALFIIPFLTTPMTAGLVYFSVRSWRVAYWSLRARLHYSLLTLAAVLFVPFLAYWNLLGFRF